MDAKTMIELVEDESFDIVEMQTTPWEQNNKWQFKKTIYCHEPSKTYWEITESRYGSPFTDWDYGDTQANQVKAMTVVKEITEYVPFE